MTTNNIKKPSMWLYLTEGIRAVFDLIKCLVFLVSYNFVNSNKTQPIMVVPGFLGSDLSTAILRWFLKKNGFSNVYGWGLGRNMGNLSLVSMLSEKTEHLYNTHQQKVILIGWSLGGVFSREISKEKPYMVQQIITLGSPFGGLEAPNNAILFYKFFNDIDKIDEQLKAEIPNPAPVPTTALYSKFDGIVPWQVCKEKVEDATHKNIEVSSSHLGFVVNVATLKIIIEILRSSR